MEATQTSATSQYSLSNPPPGASFEYDEVKTDRGQTSLGQVPILTWGDDDESIQHAIAFYGAEGISNILNGTSLRVSFQGIARNGKDPKKNWSDEQIAQKQIEFRPGRREGGQSTPTSRAQAAARKAAAALNGDAVAKLLQALASGQISKEMLAQAGVSEEDLRAPTATNGESPEGEGQDQ